jgi:hypothetical protein
MALPKHLRHKRDKDKKREYNKQYYAKKKAERLAKKEA